MKVNASVRDGRRETIDGRRSGCRHQGIQKLTHPRVGCARKAIGRLARDQSPIIQDADTIAERECLDDIVRDEDDRLAQMTPDALELVAELDARHRIERAKRFIHQEDRRIDRERSRHADTLSLAARQFVSPAAGKLRRRQSDERKQLQARAWRRCVGPPSSRGTSVTLSSTVSAGIGRPPASRTPCPPQLVGSHWRLSRPSTSTVPAPQKQRLITSEACSFRRRCAPRAPVPRRAQSQVQVVEHDARSIRCRTRLRRRRSLGVQGPRSVPCGETSMVTGPPRR